MARAASRGGRAGTTDAVAHGSTRPAPDDRSWPRRAPPGRPGRPGGCRSPWWPSSAIPVVAGSLRLLEVAGGPQLLPDQPPDRRLARAGRRARRSRRAASPWSAPSSSPPGCAAATRAGTGRRAGSSWPRAGRRRLRALDDAVLPRASPAATLLVAGVRLVFGSAMAACIVLGFTAIRRRDVAAHRAWMIRAYALALAAGTQAFTQGIGEGALRDQRPQPRTSRWAPAGSSTSPSPSGSSAAPPPPRRPGRAHARGRAVSAHALPRPGRLRAAGQRTPRPALVGLVRRPRPHPRRRRHHHPPRRRDRPGRAARPARQGPRPRGHPHLGPPGGAGPERVLSHCSRCLRARGCRTPRASPSSGSS